MSKLFSGELLVADEKTCQARWAGYRPGEGFRCYFCGRKMVPGDKYRAVYTNDLRGAGGNPLVCEQCNGTNEELRARWIKINLEVDDFLKKYWWVHHDPKGLIDQR